MLILLCLPSMAAAAPDLDLKLLQAIESNDIIEAENLIKRGVGLSTFKPDPKEDASCSAVRAAVSSERYEIAQLLLEHNAQVNPTRPRDYPPLLLAVRLNVKWVRLLLSHGSHIEFPDYVDDNGTKGESALIEAALFQKPKVLHYLINAGATINFRNGVGNTALLIAVDQNNLELVTMLVKANADVTIQNDQGPDALSRARGHRNEAIAAMLLKKRGPIGEHLLGLLELKSTPRRSKKTGDKNAKANSPLTFYEEPNEASPVVATFMSIEDYTGEPNESTEIGPIVYSMQNGWYRVFIEGKNKKGWVPQNSVKAFHAFETLLINKRTYLTEAWNYEIF